MHLTRQLLDTIVTVGVVTLAAVALMVFTVRRAEDPARVAFKWVLTLPIATLALLSVRLWGPYGVFVIAVCGIVLSILWAPHLGTLLSKPLTGAFDGGNLAPEPAPAYSIARAKQKQGHYVEAVADIRQQLDRFPRDIEGHLLLAQILAEDLHDLPGAELTIQRLIEQPGHAPKNIAFALYSLADWHLQFGQDRAAAKAALEKIIDLVPESEFALGAAQRIAHLGTSEMLVGRHDGRKFVVPDGAKNLGLLRAREPQKPREQDPVQLTTELVKQLEEHPLDTEARERLAILYADHFQRLDLATGELEQLIGYPNTPSRLVVHWLNLLADLQIRSGANYETVSQTLERIIERYPNLAAAEIARNRLALVRLELKAKEKTETLKLGNYEQKIGLKKAR